VEIIKQSLVREKLAAQLMEPVGSSPEDFRARMDGEIVRWAPVIKAANIRIN
jgi:tripartite-type tricarboxylate transporter receptor subunit TctC